MYQLNGASLSADVNFGSPGEFRGVTLEPTAWHEFWITIKADATGVGTHQVAVYVDGSTTAATNVLVTAGNGTDFSNGGYLAIGGSRTVESYALDLDFVAYRSGAVAPSKPVETLKFTSIVLQPGKVIITWTGGGVLQSSADLPGTWTDVAGTPANPATITLTGPKRFYRLKR